MAGKTQAQALLDDAIAAANQAAGIKLEAHLEEKKENKVLDAANTFFFGTTGKKLQDNLGVKRGNKALGAKITIEGQKKLRFVAEIKKWAQQANFGALVHQVRQLPGKGMLVADYVDPRMADKLRNADIPYIDTYGNVYINEKPLYVLVNRTKAQLTNREKRQGNVGKNLQGMLKTKTPGRAFQPKGLKVVYQFLTNEKILNTPYREIADKADVALGTIGWVINDLKQAGYLLEIKPKNRRLINKRKLFDRWVNAYLEKLRPKQFVGTFKTDNPFWWKDNENEIAAYGAKWGGEVAAKMLTNHLIPQETTIYLGERGGTDLFKDRQFRKDPNGDIHVFRTFWKEDEQNHPEHPCLVNPIIVYADLIGTGDVRNLEAAEKLLGGELAEFNGED